MYAIGLRYRTCLKSFTVYVRLDMTVLGKCKNLHVFQQSHLDGSTLAPFSLKFSSNPIGLLEWEPRLLPTWNFPASVSHIDIIHRLVGLVGLVAHKHHCAWTDQCPICPQSAASVREQGGFGSTTSRYTCTSFDISWYSEFQLFVCGGNQFGWSSCHRVIVWPWHLQLAQQQLASIATYLLQRSLDPPNFQCKPRLNLS